MARKPQNQSNGGAGCAAIIVVAVAGVAVFYAATWPYFFGAWIAERAGAADPSDARSIVSVLFETCYVLIILSVTAGVFARRRDVRTHAERGRVEDADRRRREAEVARLEAAVGRGRDELAGVDLALGVMKRSPQGLAGSAFPDWNDYLKPAERVLGSGVAWYTAPRVAHRGGPKIQTEVEIGRYLVTDQRVGFRGATRSETWPLARIAGVSHQAATSRVQFLFTITGRKTVSGLSVPSRLQGEILGSLLTWARGLPGPPLSATADLVAARERAAASHARVRSDLVQAQAPPVRTEGPNGRPNEGPDRSHS